MRILIPLVLALVGTGAGIGAGFMLRPEPHVEKTENPCGDAVVPTVRQAVEPVKTTREYVKLNNQFVIPVVEKERVSSLVVLSLSVEVGPGDRETVFSREPKLRDALLRVMFDHANVGGFRGAFTDSNNLDVLRQALLEAAHGAIGTFVSDILITDIARQDA